MNLKAFIVLGIIANFLGVIFLLHYYTKTSGATTEADKDYLASRWYLRFGYLSLSIGFLLQILAVSVN